jgi:hypothetical protein
MPRNKGFSHFCGNWYRRDLKKLLSSGGNHGDESDDDCECSNVHWQLKYSIMNGQQINLSESETIAK